MLARSAFLVCLICVVFLTSGSHADVMKVRDESNSVLIEAIKYVLDDLAADVHKKHASLPVKNDTVTKWDTTYYVDGLHPLNSTSAPEKLNANEMGLIVMSEYIVIEESSNDTATDFQTTLKPLAAVSAAQQYASDIELPVLDSSYDEQDVFLEEPYLLPGPVTAD